MEISNQFEALAVEECTIDRVVQAEERAYDEFKALVTERNLKCRHTRKALAERAMEEAKRKQEDVLRINEMFKFIEEEERLAEEEEAKEKRKGKKKRSGKNSKKKRKRKNGTATKKKRKGKTTAWKQQGGKRTTGRETKKTKGGQNEEAGSVETEGAGRGKRKATTSEETSTKQGDQDTRGDVYGERSDLPKLRGRSQGSGRHHIADDALKGRARPQCGTERHNQYQFF